jgi:hypothetical protein
VVTRPTDWNIARYRPVKVAAIVGMYRAQDPTAWAIADRDRANGIVSNHYYSFVTCANECARRNARGQQDYYRLVWSPEGREIARVYARSARAAIRKAPKPYRRYVGEIYAEVIS